MIDSEEVYRDSATKTSIIANLRMLRKLDPDLPVIMNTERPFSIFSKISKRLTANLRSKFEV